jgi:hypothetical protein
MNLCLLRVFSSLRLTVVLLALSMMLVFMATLAQTRLGIWEVMSRYIRTFVVWVPVGGRELPVFPGGWLLAGLLLANLIAAHASRFTWSSRKRSERGDRRADCKYPASARPLRCGGRSCPFPAHCLPQFGQAAWGVAHAGRKPHTKPWR